MDESWKKIRSELKSKLGQDIYKNWIEVLSLVKVKSNVAHFKVPSSFIANWIDRNYRDQIIESFIKEEIYIKNLLFEHNVLHQNIYMTICIYIYIYIKVSTAHMTFRLLSRTDSLRNKSRTQLLRNTNPTLALLPTYLTPTHLTILHTHRYLQLL